MFWCKFPKIFHLATLFQTDIYIERFLKLLNSMKFAMNSQFDLFKKKMATVAIVIERCIILLILLQTICSGII